MFTATLVIGDTKLSSSGVRPMISTWDEMLVTSWLTSENVVIIGSHTHINVSDVPESDVFHVWFDVSEVSEVHLDDSGDVHALHQHVQDDVGHRQLKPESTDLGHVFQLIEIFWHVSFSPVL